MGNIGIFGGTFNPVHKGHVRLLESVGEAVDFKKVIVLPDRIPPHKQADNLASGKDRYNMCRLAFEKVKNAEVSDWELKQSGKSYSVYTLRHFHELFPDDKLFFIMGSDMLLSFESWYCYEEILSLATLICISRENKVTADKLNNYARNLVKKGGEVIVLKREPFEISSSQIREKLKNHEDCSCYLDKNVVQYISDNKLYL
ncbi:MAG: nicotinate (nicotinamide) nucleotide adenylyltransferase [Oscillospiraceae bacterium]